MRGVVVQHQRRVQENHRVDPTMDVWPYDLVTSGQNMYIKHIEELRDFLPARTSEGFFPATLCLNTCRVILEFLDSRDVYYLAPKVVINDSDVCISV